MDLMGYERGARQAGYGRPPLHYDARRRTTSGSRRAIIEDFFVSSLFSTVHEAGHALYELGIEPRARSSRARKLHDAASMARSRIPVADVGEHGRPLRAPSGRATTPASPSSRTEATRGPLSGIGLDAFLRAINKVEPSLIRTEADEVTYCLHVILRFELESDLISGRLAVKDLPDAWNAKMKELLGLSAARRRAGLPPGRPLVGRSLRLFPELCPRQPLCRPILVGDEEGHARPRRAHRVGRPRLRPRMAPRQDPRNRGAASFPASWFTRVTGSSLDPAHFVAYLDEKYSRIYAF